MSARNLSYRAFCVVFAILLATPLQATPHPWPAGTLSAPRYREIGDWILGCDNTRRCVARYVPNTADGVPGGDSDLFSMMIVREEGPLGLQVRLTGFGSFDTSDMLIDGRAAPNAAWVDGDDHRDTMVHDEEAFRFLRGIVNGRELTFPSRTLRQRVSLQGLTAVLLAMDEAQGRLGDQSAFVRTGPKPFGSAPRALAPPVMAVRKSTELPAGDALAAAVRRGQTALLELHACDLTTGTGDEAHLLRDGQAVVLIGCGRFAYQTSSLAFTVDPRDSGTARLLILPQPPLVPAPDSVDALGEYVSLAFDRKRSTLTEFSKGRGMADCGSLTEWAFDGTIFRLSAFAWQQRCGGEPEQWLTLYRSDLKILP